MIWTHGNHGVKTLALAIGVLLVGMISCGCLTVRGAPLADDLSDATSKLLYTSTAIYIHLFTTFIVLLL